MKKKDGPLFICTGPIPAINFTFSLGEKKYNICAVFATHLLIEWTRYYCKLKNSIQVVKYVLVSERPK